MGDAAMKSMTRAVATAVRLSLLLTLWACTDSTEVTQPPDPPRASAISISPGSVTLDFLGATATLTATVTDQYGAAFVGAVTWSSTVPTFFSVTPNGVVTALANGAGTVRATIGNLTDTATVTVAQTPAKMTLTGGGDQEALPGGRLREAVAVQVTDRGGAGVSGAAVRFAVADDHGSVEPDSTTTHMLGDAATIWTLGEKTGPQLLTVSAGPELRVRVTATGTTGHAMEVVSGGRQRALPGEALRDPVVVRVLDSHGEGFPGTIVRFAAQDGHGAASPDSVRTDANGEAAAIWTLGDTVGAQWLEIDVGHGPSTRIAATGLTGLGVCDRTPEVRQLIMEYVGVRNCAAVTRHQLSRVQHMGYPGNRPQSLEGLTHLYADDFAGLTGLEVLHFSNYSSAELPPGLFSDLESLTILSFRRSPELTELPDRLFAGLSQLEDLRFTESAVTDLPNDLFDGLTSLATLDLSRNVVQRLPTNIFRDLTGLTSLDLASNQLATLPEGVAHLASLERLIISGNPITHLSADIFRGLSSLRTLGAVFSLDADAMDEVSDFTLADASLPTPLSFHNGSAAWSVATPSSPSVAVALRQRDAAPHQVTDLPADLLAPLANLDTLSLGGSFREIPTGFFDPVPGLRSLSLGGPIQVFPSNEIAHLSSLEYFRLSDTEITELPDRALAGLRSLERLYISRNTRLESIAPTAFVGTSSLEKIQFVSNRLQSLPNGLFSSSPRLKSIWIDEKSLEELPDSAFAGLSALEQLVITAYWGSRSDFGEGVTRVGTGLIAGSSKLRVLWLHGKVRVLPEGVLNGAPNIETLELDHNRIRTLPKGFFSGMVKLRKMSFIGNSGSPFALRATFQRTDTTDLAAPGPATAVVTIAEGAPLEVAVRLSATGGTLSLSSIVIPAGAISSDSFTVTRNSDHSGPVTLSMTGISHEPVQFSNCPNREWRCFWGISIGRAGDISLFR